MALQGFNIDVCQTAAGLAGLGVLEYVAVDELAPGAYDPALNADYNQQASLGIDWLSLPYVIGSGRWSEDLVDADQGDYYKLNISSFLPGDSLAIRKEVNAMRDHRYLLRIRRNNMTLLLGTPEQPLKYSSTFDSGGQAADQRGYRMTFTGVSLQKSPGYVPTF